MGLIFTLLGIAFVASIFVAYVTDDFEVREFAFLVAKISGFLLVGWTMLLIFSMMLV